MFEEFNYFETFFISFDLVLQRCASCGKTRACLFVVCERKHSLVCQVTTASDLLYIKENVAKILPQKILTKMLPQKILPKYCHRRYCPNISKKDIAQTLSKDCHTVAKRSCKITTASDFTRPINDFTFNLISWANKVFQSTDFLQIFLCRLYHQPIAPFSDIAVGL